MTAKKDIIKELRKEIEILKSKNISQASHLKRQENELFKMKKDNFLAFSGFEDYGKDLLRKFERELAWQALTPEPNLQLEYLRWVAMRIKTDVRLKTKVFMEKYPEEQVVKNVLRRREYDKV